MPPQLFSFTSKHGELRRFLLGFDDDGLLMKTTYLSISTQGHTVHGMMFQAAPQYSGPRPTILYIYGGPHVQVVADEYRGMRYSYLSLYAQLGYNVVAVDCRGSSRRGLHFEGAARWQMVRSERDCGVQLSNFFWPPSTLRVVLRLASKWRHCSI